MSRPKGGKGGSIPDPIRNDRRRAKRRHKFPPGTACIHCGIDDPLVLIEVGRSLLERQHPDGETYDPDLVVADCRNCHAIDTEAQVEAGVDVIHRSRSLLAALAGGLHTRAVFLRSLADAHERDAEQLTALAARLDQEWPQWRQPAEAQR